MLAHSESSPDTMEEALTFTLAALDAEAEMNIDLSQEDRNALVSESQTLEVHYNNFTNARNNLRSYSRQLKRFQRRVKAGDATLDSGISSNKKKTVVALERIMPEGANIVFGSNIKNLTAAELELEPELVRQAITRFNQLPEFPGKAEIIADLERRIGQQEQAIRERKQGELARVMLADNLELAIKQASEALYKLEKRLLERFPREKDYVRSFFWDTSSRNRVKKEQPEQPEQPAAQ